MCEEFEALFRQYIRAGRANIRIEHSTPATRRAVQVAREAIYRHKRECPTCQCLSEPAFTPRRRCERVGTDCLEPLRARPNADYQGPRVWQMELEGVTG